MSQKSNSALTDNSTPNSAPHSAPVPELLTLRGLAKVIGVDPGQLSKEAGRSGFPSHATEQGVLYLADEVLGWRQSNVRQKRPSKSVYEKLPAASPVPAIAADVARPPVPPPPPPAAIVKARRGHRPSQSFGEGQQPPPLPDAAELVEILKSGKASALEISRATVQLAALRVGIAQGECWLGPQDLDALKKSLQELRSAEADYLELEQRKLQLIPREIVRTIIGECSARLVNVTDKLKSALAMEMSVWLANPEVATMSADERSLLIRQFVSKTTAEIKRAEADDVDAMIKQSIADAEAA